MDMQGIIDKMTENIESELFASIGNTTAEPSPPLTMDILKEAMQRIKAFPTSPPIPQLIRMPWPEKQARSHRKRRINKKWAKKYGKTIDIPVDKGQCYSFRDCVYDKPVAAAYPRTFEKLRYALSCAA